MWGNGQWYQDPLGFYFYYDLEGNKKHWKGEYFDEEDGDHLNQEGDSPDHFGQKRERDTDTRESIMASRGNRITVTGRPTTNPPIGVQSRSAIMRKKNRPL